MSDKIRAGVWFAAFSAALTLISMSAEAGTWTGRGDEEALCRSVDDGTACDAINRGVTDRSSGLAWRRLSEDGDFAKAAVACAALGNGWRLPTLAELDHGFQTDAFGYCSMAVWSADQTDRGEAWVQGAVYEGSSVCQTEQDGTTVCIGGCGMMGAQREPESTSAVHGILCVKGAA